MRQARRIRQKLSLLVTLVRHGTELIHFEDLLAPAGPLLAEDHRAAQFEAHQYGYHQQHRGQHDERAAGEKNVQQPLDTAGVNTLLFLFHKNTRFQKD